MKMMAYSDRSSNMHKFHKLSNNASLYKSVIESRRLKHGKWISALHAIEHTGLNKTSCDYTPFWIVIKQVLGLTKEIYYSKFH